MKELSIFIDESGDFGDYSKHSPYYIIAMVFHDQINDISIAVDKLNERLSYANLNDSCVHTGPIIRQEGIYSGMEIIDRRKIFNNMLSFIRQIDIKYKCFSVEKKHLSGIIDITSSLSKLIALFIRHHYEEFSAYDIVKIYYDNGQIELTKTISSVFSSLLPNPVFKRVSPSEYKLFQTADLLCTMELIKIKLQNGTLSNSEVKFFGNDRNIRRNYLKPLIRKEWK